MDDTLKVDMCLISLSDTPEWLGAPSVLWLDAPEVFALSHHETHAYCICVANARWQGSKKKKKKQRKKKKEKRKI